MHNTLAAFTLHSSLHIITSALMPPIPQLSLSQRLMLCEKPAAIVNALLVSLPPLHALLFDSPFESDVLHTFPRVFEHAFDRHLGFTLYDLTVMLLSPTEHPSAYIHHILGIAGILTVKHFRVAVLFPGLFLPSELTVVVSSALWIIKTLEINTPVTQTLLLIRFLMFVALRIAASPTCLIYPVAVTARKNRLPYKVAFIKHLKEFNNLESVVKAGVVVNTLAFTTLNCYWTVLTFKALLRSSSLVSSVHHI